MWFQKLYESRSQNFHSQLSQEVTDSDHYNISKTTDAEDMGNDR